ncbi:MAG: Ig-like domain-containing protein [Planctomycetia bacterium]|nr:Ig-like domain-containing protein [Planctomycetia bacterium]
MFDAPNGDLVVGYTRNDWIDFVRLGPNGVIQGDTTVTFPNDDFEDNFHPSFFINDDGDPEAVWLTSRYSASSEISNSVSVSTPIGKPVSAFVSYDDTGLLSGPLTLSLPGLHSVGGVSINQNGTPNNPTDDVLVYKPISGFQGVEEVVYHLTDSRGHSTCGVLRVHVGEPVPASEVSANQRLFSVTDIYSTKEDVILKVTLANGVLKNDTKINSDKLIATLVTAPQHGTLTFNPNGAFNYSPAPNFSGADSFTYRVSSGTIFSPPATVTLNITSVADKPKLIVPKSITGAPNSDLNLPITGTLADTDGSEILMFKLSGVPAFATLNHGEKQVDGTWKLTTTDLVGLTVRAPRVTSFTLKVTCLASESVGTSEASVVANIAVKIA